MRCEAGKLLSYNFIAHHLENRSVHCGNSCVDYVEVDLPSLGGEVVTTCGMEAQLGVIYSDGTSAIDVEFVANRREQDSGFMLFVWCSDPGFDINAQSEIHSSRRRRKRDEQEESQRGGEDSEEDAQPLVCTQPSSAPRPTVDSLERLVSVCVCVCVHTSTPACVCSETRH